MEFFFLDLQVLKKFTTSCFSVGVIFFLVRQISIFQAVTTLKQCKYYSIFLIGFWKLQSDIYYSRAMHTSVKKVVHFADWWVSKKIAKISQIYCFTKKISEWHFFSTSQMAIDGTIRRWLNFYNYYWYIIRCQLLSWLVKKNLGDILK